MNLKPCEYCGCDLPMGVDKNTRRLRSFHFERCEVRLAQKAKHDADKVEELLRWKGIHAPRLAALEELYRASQLDAGAGREAAATLDSERRANAILTEEVEALRAANEAFGKRQEWWDQKMLAMEEKARADEALHRQALEALESYSKSPYIKHEHPKRHANGAKAINALRERLGRSGG